MRKLAWKNLLRTTLLTTAVSLGLNAAFDPMLLRSTVVAAEESAAAATVEEATKVIDLSTLPLANGASESFGRHLGSVTYEVASDSKAAFQFHQKQLTKLGWKELPTANNQAQYVSANFQKEGFTISVASYASSDPSKPKSAMVSITNVGNVRLSKLPAVKGAKQVFASDVSASYSTTLKPAEATTATRKLLSDAGWESYGSASNPPDSEVMTFKRNAIRLTVFVGVSPVQKGQVMISYSATLMAADIPAPTNAKDVGFDDVQKVLKFQSSDTFDDVAKFYQQRLAKMGWKPDSKELSQTKYGDDRPLGELHFQNTAKDSLLLQLTEEDGATHARLSLRTVADIAARQKELRAATVKLAAEDKARKQADEADAETNTPRRPKVAAADSDDDFPDVDALIKGAVGDALKDGNVDLDKLTKSLNAKVKEAEKEGTKGANKAPAKDAVSIPIPDDVKKVDQTRENVMQIKLPAGKGKATAELIRDQLLASDWESSDDDKTTAKSGNLTLKKGRQQLTMSYVDTGFSDVSLMLIGFAVKLEQGKIDPNAKVPVASSKPKSKPKADDDSPEDEPKPSKKTAKKKSKSDSSSEAKAVVEPKRVEKPKRDIAKLDKLPNEAKVIANDEPIALPHLVAYEVISDGRWVTKVVATEKPIRKGSLLAALQKTGTDEGIEIQSPRITLELDDQDSPNTMSYTAPQTIGSASRSGLTGEAVVEEGRARGTFKSKKASEFFGRTITGEISFDLPVMTRHDKPTKLLTDAPKLENSGQLLVSDKPVKLGSVVAYQVKVFDDVRTAILFTEKPINMTKLKASLAKDGSDSGLFEFQSQVKIEIDKEDRATQMQLWHDNASLNSNSDLVGDVIVEDGRARGTVKLGKPSEFVGKTFSFEITFDIEVLPLPSTTAE